VRDINSSSKFIENNMFLARIPAPKLRVWILSKSVTSGVVPSFPRFSSTSSTPEYVASSDHSNWPRKVSADCSESPITLNSNRCRDVDEVTCNGQVPDSDPIQWVVSFKGPFPEVELRSGDSSVFFPDIISCGCASGDLGVDAGSEQSGES